MVEVVNQSALSTYAIRSINTYFLTFILYLIISIPATYDITTNLSKKLSKVKPNNKFIIPIVTVTLFILPVILDLLYLVYALKDTYYELYMKALYLHANIYNLVKPDVNFTVYKALSLIIGITGIYYAFRILRKYSIVAWLIKKRTIVEEQLGTKDG